MGSHGMEQVPSGCKRRCFVTACLKAVVDSADSELRWKEACNRLDLNLDYGFMSDNLEKMKHLRCCPESCETCAPLAKDSSSTPSAPDIDTASRFSKLSNQNLAHLESELFKISAVSSCFGRIDGYSFMTCKGQHDTSQLKKLMMQHKSSGAYPKLKESLTNHGFKEIDWKAANSLMCNTHETLEQVYAIKSKDAVVSWFEKVDQLSCVFPPPSDAYIINAVGNLINDQYVAELVSLAKERSPTWTFTAYQWLEFMLSDPVVQLECKIRATDGAADAGNTFAGFFLFFSPFYKGSSQEFTSCCAFSCVSERDHIGGNYKYFVADVDLGIKCDGSTQDQIVLQVEVKNGQNKAPFVMYGSIKVHDNVGNAYLFPLPWIYDFKLGQGNHQNAKMTPDTFDKIREYNDSYSFFHYVSHMLIELAARSGKGYTDIDNVAFNKNGDSSAAVRPAKKHKKTVMETPGDAHTIDFAFSIIVEEFWALKLTQEREGLAQELKDAKEANANAPVNAPARSELIDVGESQGLGNIPRQEEIARKRASVLASVQGYIEWFPS